MTISVIIPTYNEANYITATLRQWQELRRLKKVEIIVTDDGSTDDTLQQVQGLADKIVQRPAGMHRGIGANRNRGAAVATGQLYWFMDADVRISNLINMFKQVIQALAQQPHVLGVTFKCRAFLEQERWMDRFFLWWRNAIIYSTNRWFGLGFGSGECQIVRATDFKALHGYQAGQSAEDHDLFRRLAKRGQVQLWWNHYIEISPRRFHQEGWAKVLWLWGRVLIGWFVFRRVHNQSWVARR